MIDAYILHESNIEFEAEVQNEIKKIKEKSEYIKNPDKKNFWKDRYKQIEEFDEPEDMNKLVNDCKSSYFLTFILSNII